MLNIEKGQRVYIWEVEDKGKYSLVKMSSSRKDKKSGEYVYSNWAFVRFVGSAHEKASDLEPKTRIELKGAGISSEMYMKDGEKAYPKTPQMVVFNFDWMDENEDEDSEKPKPKPSSKPKTNKPKLDEPPQIEDEPEEEGLPF